jgi:hypothetical protein
MWITSATVVYKNFYLQIAGNKKPSATKVDEGFLL